jgi:hypothetical protein
VKEQVMMARFVAVTLAAAFSMLAAAPGALAEPLAGDVFAEEGGGNSLFQVERFWTTNGDGRMLTERFKKTGGVAASYEASYVSNRLAGVLYDQGQSHEKASAVFKEGHVYYTVTADGGTRQSDQRVATEWIPFPAVPDEIVKNWGPLMQGANVTFKMPIPIMRDNFTFELFKNRTWTKDNKQFTEFKLEPSSLAVRMLASAMYYVFEDKRRTLVEYRGRTIVKIEKHGKLEDLNAVIEYRSGAAPSAENGRKP